jgi:glycosyltransferase involved in cell wall biosynthesis
MADKSIMLVRSDVRLAGPGILMHNIALGLRERGWNVAFATGGGELVDQVEQDGFPHFTIEGLRIGDRSALAMLRGARAIRRISRKRSVSFVHSFNAQAGLLAWFATRGQGVRVINTVLGAGKERLLAFIPLPLVAVSDFVRRSLTGYGIADDRIVVVHNGIIPEERVVDRASFDRLINSGRGLGPDFRLVSIAMMHGDKGHQSAMEALELALAHGGARRPHLTFVGDGQMRHLLEGYARDRGLGDRVDFAGAQKDVYPFLDHADAFVHLSPQETFGMVLAEAQARGLPVISYAVGGVPEVVADGDTGLLVASGDVSGVAAAMTTLAANPIMAAEMGWRGAERTRAMFTRPRLAARLEEVYLAMAQK